MNFVPQSELEYAPSSPLLNNFILLYYSGRR